MSPDEAQPTARLLMDAFYPEDGINTLQGPVAWVQKRVIYANLLSDLAERRRQYDAGGGALLVAATAAAQADDIAGFVDVGLFVYNQLSNTYDLPPRRFDSVLPPECERRAYVSNLAVSPLERRLGVGRELMTACEQIASGWETRPNAIWLECSASNEAGLRFYEALGYERAGTSIGREIVRRRFSFEPTEVERVVMRKSLANAAPAVERPDALLS